MVRDDNLPIPVFIRGDDVEYGLRNAKNIIALNGICVWHEPFENKYSSAMYYYILRNRLIDNALHGREQEPRSFIRVMRNWVKSEVYLYRYKNARLLLQGVSDYYRGIDWLKEQDSLPFDSSSIPKYLSQKSLLIISLPRSLSVLN